MIKEEIHFDFNKIDDAKRFIYNLWIENRRVGGVQIPSGWLDFDAMTDDQLMTYATELCNEWLNQPGSKMEYREPVLQ